MRARSSRHAVPVALVLWFLLAVAACAEDNTGGLSDAAYRYCTTEASPEELAAAAAALNLMVQPEAFADGSQDAGDPVFAQACEYAYQARGQDLDPGPQGQPGVPGDASPTAPLGPQASGVDVTPAPVSPSP